MTAQRRLSHAGPVCNVAPLFLVLLLQAGGVALAAPASVADIQARWDAFRDQHFLCNTLFPPGSPAAGRPDTATGLRNTVALFTDAIGDGLTMNFPNLCGSPSTRNDLGGTCDIPGFVPVNVHANPLVFPDPQTGAPTVAPAFVGAYTFFSTSQIEVKVREVVPIKIKHNGGGDGRNAVWESSTFAIKVPVNPPGPSTFNTAESTAAFCSQQFVTVITGNLQSLWVEEHGQYRIAKFIENGVTVTTQEPNPAKKRLRKLL